MLFNGLGRGHCKLSLLEETGNSKYGDFSVAEMAVSHWLSCYRARRNLLSADVVK